LGNISGIALILGILILIGNRMKASEQRGIGSFFDWSLILVIGAVAITGFLAEIVRLSGAAKPAYFVYFLHLVFVFYLFAFMPYTKFAHIVYRTVALVYVKYTGREIVTEPSVDYQKAEAEEAAA
jgi:quinone-modifying oxidoreductase subunit QmoC